MGVPGVVAAPGGDIEQLGGPAQPHHGPLLAVAKGEVGDGDALQVDLQDGGEAHIPERGGNDELIRRRELPGGLKHGLLQLARTPKRVPLGQHLRVLWLEPVGTRDPAR